MKGDFMTVRFDRHNPASEKRRAEDVRGSLAGLDYSPLPRVTGRSLAMGVLVSMGGMIFGYDTGQISGFLAMPDFLDRFGQTDANGDKYFSEVRSGLIVSLLSIGTLFGALSGAPIADKIGRRASISLWSAVTSVGFVIQIAASSAWYQIMIGRFVAGLGVGGLSLLLFITMGIFLAACFNYGTVTHQGGSSASWRIVIGLGWVWTLVLGFGILAFPETPRFDYRRGRVERARATLCRVYGAGENHWAVHTQIEEIESKLRAEDKIQQGPVAEFVGMFRAPRMAYRIALGVALQMFQQLTGANYFFYYGTTIFKSVQIDSFITQIILNTINFATTFLGLYIVEHYGRRKSLIGGAAWMFVCLMIFASVGHFVLDVDDPASTPTPGIVLIVFGSLFVLGFATTWGPMIWTIQAELAWPSAPPATGSGTFASASSPPFIVKAIDYSYGYVFAGCNFVAALLVYFFVVEGQGRTLEEIDTMYLEGVKPWRSTGWEPPSAEHMARLRRQAGVDLEDGGSEGGLSGDTTTDGHPGLGRKKESGNGEELMHQEHA
ncbi:hypothetical protein ACCO45_006150 [Purpureocillium lilacinum]|uniref:Uncharacterized protein n=1 Tax=Purpureocillium lilacinum TaxID=33203 RepID=A0ACC4DY78_PURLI